ncbi:MAG: AAC(3) family N-acetyltransferase [Crocinitomicaceae bacterium]|nr:AAC(3) family N-acetyltransferase [Crocinitomicaceae bacterium]
MQNLIKKLVPSFIKERIKNFRKKRRFKKFQSEAAVLTKQELITGFNAAGISRGDVLFVHSSLKGLGYIEHGPQDIIEAFQEVIGPEGTLVFPTFSIKGNMLDTLSDPNYVFDVSTTPSTVGTITNYFRCLPGVMRSVHPTHSVAAWGKYAKDLTEKHHECDSNFGKGTPFGKFYDLNGKIVGLGIDYGNVTYYHVYEDFNPEKWPNVYLPKPFTARVVDQKGVQYNCIIKCHNPEFHLSRIEKVPEIEAFFSQYLEENKVSFRTQIGNGHLWWMNAKDLIEHLDKLYEKEISIYNVKQAIKK